MSWKKVAKASLGAIAVILIGYAVLKWPHWRASGETASAYVARITCSCRFVEGRSAESCAQDVKEYARFVSVKENIDEKRVTGTVALLGHAEARFASGYGCLMQPD
jgi:hypothetical protein